MKDVTYCNDLFKYYSLVHIRTLLGTLFWSPSAGRQGFRLFGMVHDAMPSRGKVIGPTFRQGQLTSYLRATATFSKMETVQATLPGRKRGRPSL